MTKEYENESSTPDDRLFVEHLEQASRIVRSWPVWKQRVLGHIIDSDEKTCPDSEHAEGPPRLAGASNIAAGELDEYRELHKKNQEEIYRLRTQVEELQGRHDALDEATKQAQELDMGY